MPENINHQNIKGQVRASRIIGGQKQFVTPWRSNLVMFEWATIVGKLLTQGLTNYRIGGMYLEHENVASPGDAVSVPAFDRSGGIEYYNGLSTDPDRDYLRVPLVASQVAVVDATDFPNGNELTFFAQTQGVEGVHGKPFDDTNNSKVFGGALVSFVNEDDATQDIVFSRFYFDVADQQVKLPTSQIGLDWKLTLE